MGNLSNSVFDITTLGYIFQEMIQYPGGDRVGPLLGGTVAYSSAALGRLGATVGIVSNIGPDTDEEIIRPLREAGVDTSGLNVRYGASVTKDVLVYDESGDKVIHYLTRAPRIGVADIPRSYLDSSVFYLCPVDYEIELDTLAFLREEVGSVTAADLGGFGGAHTSPETRAEHESGHERFEDYARLLSYAKASMEDCHHLFHGAIDSPERAAEALHDFGVEVAVITLGPDGAIASRRGGERHTFAAFDTTAVDTTGAGDTFMAAFLLELLRTGEINRAGKFATAAASLLVECTGGVTMERVPDTARVRDRLTKME